MAQVRLDALGNQQLLRELRAMALGTTLQKRVEATIRQLLTANAPPSAVGEYEWHVRVEGACRIVLKGGLVRTVYPLRRNYPSGREFRLIGYRLLRY